MDKPCSITSVPTDRVLSFSRRNSGQLRRFAMQHCCHWHVTAVRVAGRPTSSSLSRRHARAQRPRGACVRALRAGVGLRGDTRVRTCGEGESQNTDIIPVSMAPIALNSINKINTFIEEHIINSSQACRTESGEPS